MQQDGYVSVNCGNFAGIVDFSYIMVLGVLGLLEGKQGHHISEGGKFLDLEVLVLLLRHNIFLWWWSSENSNKKDKAR